MLVASLGPGRVTCKVLARPSSIDTNIEDKVTGLRSSAALVLEVDKDRRNEPRVE